MSLLTFAESLIESLKNAFESYKKVDVFHVTSDHQLFPEENHATFHASKLADKTVTPVTRADFEALQAQPAEDKAAADAAQKKS